MSNVRDDVDLQEALRMLEIPEEVLGRMIEQGKIKARHVDGVPHFLREDIMGIIEFQVEEELASEFPGDDLGETPFSRRQRRKSMIKTFCDLCSKELELVDGKVEKFVIEISECTRNSRSGAVVEMTSKLKREVCGSCKDDFEKALDSLRGKTNNAAR